MITELFIIAGLILLNGIFSMAEIAVVSARKSKLEHSAGLGDKKSETALRLANNPGRFLSTIQIGITVVTLLTGLYSGTGIAAKFSLYLKQFPLFAKYSDSISLAIVLFIVTFLSIVFGELIPKQIGIMRAESIARQLSRPMNFLSLVTLPFIWLLSKPVEFIIKFLRIKPSADSKVTEEEIKAIIKEGTEDGEIKEIEQDIVERVFHLGDRRVGSLMTHRNDLVWININDTEEAIKNKIIDELHSIYPVCDDDLDKILGIIHIKDLLTCNLKQEEFEIKKYLKEPLFILENNSAYEVLERFRETKTHFGIIIDEYGSILGLISLNDILEALVGEMPAEEGLDYEITPRSDGSFLIDAQIPFIEFVQQMEISFADATKVKYNTLGGFALNILHHIPKTGEKFIWRDFQFEIVDMDGNRIDKILFSRIDK